MRSRQTNTESEVMEAVLFVVVVVGIVAWLVAA